MQKIKPYLLECSHLESLREGNYEIAILPWGATEAHNYHLPYGTDTFETEAIAQEAASMAWKAGVRCIVLPALPFGVNTGQSDIPGTINIYPSTQSVILHDILESLQIWGIEKFLLLNGHGGNDFKQILREAGREFPDILMVTANWFQSVDKEGFFAHEGDHADEMETSLMMHLQPELVLPLEKAGEGHSGRFTVEGLNESWAWTERKWTKVTKDTGIGNPKMSEPDKGRRYFIEVSKKVSALIIGLAQTPHEKFYTQS